MVYENSINYPDALDTEQNLYDVHDALRLVLAEDYNPGDSIIQFVGDSETVSRFPQTGIITLTDQCSDYDKRALSLYYGLKTNTTFEQLEILNGFEDCFKPKYSTNITQNVMSYHRNILKDATISIEEFAGKEGEVGTKALEGTIEERTNYLRKIVLPPKAWFSANKTIGLVPFTVEFTDLSFRLGTDGTSSNIKRTWNFGDAEGPSIIEYQATDEVPSEVVNVIVEDTDGGTIRKTYTSPGIYTVSLTVENDFGEDTVEFPEMISARVKAPDEAIIKITPRSNQILTQGSPVDGPYETNPKIRTPINNLIDIYIQEGVNDTTGKSYGGEELKANNSPIDPITTYTWALSDDLIHNNSSLARASYSIGGIYDLILRVDTALGAYRITTYEDAIDVVEKENLWLWNISNGSAKSYEFGLISETFKPAGSLFSVDYNTDFLDDEVNQEQQLREFKKNNGFAKRGNSSSGSGGSCVLYWASGRSNVQTILEETVKLIEYNGYTDIYTNSSEFDRPWNWTSLNSETDVYFLWGQTTEEITPNSSPTNQTKHMLSLQDLSTSSVNILASNYKNGADELRTNVVTYDDSGDPLQGHISVYRSTWKDESGYILRNEGVGNFFRIKSFYKTSGTTSSPVTDIKKLADMDGSAKVEGQLVSLSRGVYFFSNSGSFNIYDTVANVWKTGGPGVNSSSFRLLQDSTVQGFDDQDQTLIAVSDGESNAYLSFDYSSNAFIKFNEIDLTFNRVASRPSGEQWLMGIY
jgi:PKD repeat protein